MNGLKCQFDYGFDQISFMYGNILNIVMYMYYIMYVYVVYYVYVLCFWYTVV